MFITITYLHTLTAPLPPALATTHSPEIYTSGYTRATHQKSEHVESVGPSTRTPSARLTLRVRSVGPPPPWLPFMLFLGLNFFVRRLGLYCDIWSNMHILLF